MDLLREIGESETEMNEWMDDIKAAMAKFTKSPNSGRTTPNTMVYFFLFSYFFLTIFLVINSFRTY